MAEPAEVVVVGGGNMGQAIVRGCVEAGAPPAGAWHVVEPDAEKRAVFGEWGVGSSPDASGAAERVGPETLVLLAVKPQMLEGVAGGLRGAWGERLSGALVASILAGVPAARVRGALGGGVRVVRVMPNTPVAVRRGMCAVAHAEGAEEADADRVERLLRGVGDVVRIDESLMDAFTGVAGSGPAYLFYLAEGMVAGAVEAGFDEATALRIVRGTLAGAAELLARDGRTPAELRAGVTSKGGTTAAACGVLDAADAMAAVARAVVAARDRGRELGAG